MNLGLHLDLMDKLNIEQLNFHKWKPRQRAESIEEVQQLNVELKTFSLHTAHTRDSREGSFRFHSLNLKTQSWERFSHNSSPMPVCIIDDKPSIHKSIKLPLFLAETMRIYFCISLRLLLLLPFYTIPSTGALCRRQSLSPTLFLFFALPRAYIYLNNILITCE